MSQPRVLTTEDRRLVTDALRLAAAEARIARSKALLNPGKIGHPAVTAQVDELARRAHACDRLAAEVAEHEVRLEKVVS